MRVLVTPTSFRPNDISEAMMKLSSFADEIIYNTLGRPLEEDELIPLLQGCDGYIAGLDFVTRKVIESCPGLKVISRYGVGVDRVDLGAAAEKGVVVCNTPGVNAQAVADLTIGLVLSVARKIPALDKLVRQGEWARSTGTELYRKTYGIVGLGAIGKAVAERAKGFSMKVLAYDPYINVEYAREHSIEAVDFSQLVAESDIISLHLPVTKQTRHMIDEQSMRAMKRGVILVNTARGGLIDEKAALNLLQTGHIGGLGLDAFELEPPGHSPLFMLDNVVATPHTGAHTYEAVANMSNTAVENLILVLSNLPCSNIVVA